MWWSGKSFGFFQYPFGCCHPPLLPMTWAGSGASITSHTHNPSTSLYFYQNPQQVLLKPPGHVTAPFTGFTAPRAEDCLLIPLELQSPEEGQWHGSSSLDGYWMHEESCSPVFTSQLGCLLVIWSLSHLSEPYFPFLKNEDGTRYLNIGFLWARPDTVCFMFYVSFHPHKHLMRGYWH